MVILCLDYGSRYVGVAITDGDGQLALRHSVLDQKEVDVMDEVESLIDEEHVEKILVGVPMNLEGEETEQTHVSLAFIEELRQVTGDTIEIEGVDETLTSVEAMQNIEMEGGNEKEEHAEAARIMLDTYLKVAA